MVEFHIDQIFQTDTGGDVRIDLPGHCIEGALHGFLQLHVPVVVPSRVGRSVLDLLVRHFCPRKIAILKGRRVDQQRLDGAARLPPALERSVQGQTGFLYGGPAAHHGDDAPAAVIDADCCSLHFILAGIVDLDVGVDAVEEGRRFGAGVVEGVAVYAETFKVNASKSAATLGGGRNVFRIQCALESLFVDKDYVSLREYAGLSREEFQNRRDIATLYSEAAGLAYFFMHYDNGVYRDAFVTYLYNVYQGIDSRDSLEKVTGKTFEELDREYIDFMQSLYHASK